MVRYIISVAIEIVCFLAVGLLFFTPQLLNPKTTDFSFTIFGVCAVLFFNGLEFKSTRALSYVPLVVAFVVFILWFRNDSAAATARNALWLLLIAGGTYISWRVLLRQTAWNSLVLAVVIWPISFVVVYVVMGLLNIFVFRFYHVGWYYEGVRITAGWYLIRGVEIGAVLGFGIGIGFIISGFLNKGIHATRWYWLSLI